MIPRDAIETWQHEFARLGAQRFPRALKFAVNKVAREAQIGIGHAIDRVVDRPAQFTRVTDLGRKSSVRVRSKSLNKSSDNLNLADVSAGVVVRDKQSAYLKYLMGEMIRRPGDVGLGNDYLGVPYWPNLTELQGITPDATGGLHKNALKTLHRRKRKYSSHSFMRMEEGKERDALYRNRMSDSQYGTTFFGRPSGRSNAPEGWYSRAEGSLERSGPVIKSGRNAGMKRLERKGGGPRLLIAALPQTEHEPILLQPWNDAVTKAASRLGQYLEAELSDRLLWQGRYDNVRYAGNWEGDDQPWPYA